MQYCVEHPEEMNKISKIKSQVAEVKGIMMDNIEKVSAIFPVVLTLQWHMNYKPC
jgi:vesicle-associated membrane protein 72